MILKVLVSHCYILKVEDATPERVTTFLATTRGGELLMYGLPVTKGTKRTFFTFFAQKKFFSTNLLNKKKWNIKQQSIRLYSAFSRKHVHEQFASTRCQWETMLRAQETFKCHAVCFNHQLVGLKFRGSIFYM